MQIVLGEFSAKAERYGIFMLTVGNDSLYETNNGNDVRIVNFAPPKNLIFKNTMFPHHNIHKYTCGGRS
jgi:hypothetical protein